MIDSVILLCVSVVLGLGMAILLVEKGNDWPIKPVRIRIQAFLHDYISYKFAQVLFCTTCTSFWTTLISDIILCCIGLLFGVPYFFWPFSGFITAGISWIIIEYLNAIDKEPNINVFVDNKGEENEILPIDNDIDDATDL